MCFTRSPTRKILYSHQVWSHDKPLLPLMKPEKSAKILSQLPSSTTMNQPQLVTNSLIRRGWERAGLRRKAPGTHPLLKPNLFYHSLQIQRQPFLKSYKFQAYKDWFSPNLWKENDQ